MPGGKGFSGPKPGRICAELRQSSVGLSQGASGSFRQYSSRLEYMMTIAEVEAQLLRHAHAERQRWQEVAPLLMQVERERLWEGHASSFTAWLQGVARRLDLQESVLW